MKTFTKVIAALMLVAVFATLMTACGKSNYVDDNLVGTWTQVDDVDGNWTWTFNKDGTCKLTSDTANFESDGKFEIEKQGSGKITISLDKWQDLDKWEKDMLFTYTATSKVIDLESFDHSFYCKKVQ